MTYTVYFTESCAKQFKKLQRALSGSDNFRRISKKLEEIKADPTIGEQLTGVLKDLCSVHAGDYRIVYKFSAEQLEIQVWAVGHRNKVYDEIMRYLKATEGSTPELIPSPISEPR
jgi:addiction module RelE/StbE family toxin